MKKLVPLLSLLMCITFTGCSQISKKSAEKKITTDISQGISTNGSAFSFECDMDFDNEDESITMKIVINEEEPWDSSLQVVVGDYKTELPMMDGRIDAVYVCDIDSTDGVRDIAVITNEASDDPRIRILKYASDLSTYQFVYDCEGGRYDELWLGYAMSYYFNVNDDYTITLEMQTPSYGMWSVYKTFSQKDLGDAFCEVVDEKYEILPDFMEKAYTDDMSGNEFKMWKKGYILAYCDYDDGALSIKKGEYVKPIYDNGKNKVYVEKEDGTGGWMNIDYAEGYNPAEFNQYFFFLAG